jgi:hypothetical protein
MSPQKFADKYHLAVEQSIKEKPQSGLNGFEQESHRDKSLAQYKKVLRTVVISPVGASMN